MEIILFVLFLFSRSYHAFQTDSAGPDAPTNLAVSNIANSSARLQWNSEIQFTDFIYVPPDQGTNDSFTYVLEHLVPGSFYKLKVAAVSVTNESVERSNTSVEFWTRGPPHKPKDLYISDLTPASVVIHWTSGYDGGSPQSFMVFKWIRGTEYIQYSQPIYDNSSSHKVGDRLSYNLTYLHPDTDYRLRVVANNEVWQPTMSDSYVEFTTKNRGSISASDRILSGLIIFGVVAIHISDYLSWSN